MHDTLDSPACVRSSSLEVFRQGALNCQDYHIPRQNNRRLELIEVLLDKGLALSSMGSSLVLPLICLSHNAGLAHRNSRLSPLTSDQAWQNRENYQIGVMDLWTISLSTAEV